MIVITFILMTTAIIVMIIVIIIVAVVFIVVVACSVGLASLVRRRRPNAHVALDLALLFSKHFLERRRLGDVGGEGAAINDGDGRGAGGDDGRDTIE